MTIDIPIELLRTLVLLADLGSLRRAAGVVHRSPSALSLQMSRLEALVEAALFVRQGRALTLTPAGLVLLGHARDILHRHDTALLALKGAASAGVVRFGLVQDFAEPLLAGLLAGFRQRFPLAQLEIRIAPSAQLAQAVVAEEIDIAVLAQMQPGVKPVLQLPMVWIGERLFATQTQLALVLVSPPCPYGQAALAALQQAGRAHHIALSTPSLDGVRAALQAGFGIGCRTRLFAAGRLPILGAEVGLPPLPQIGFSVLRGGALSPAATALAEMAEQALIALS